MKSQETETLILNCNFCEGRGIVCKNGATILCPNCNGLGYLKIKAKTPSFHKNGESKEVCYRRLRREQKHERELNK